MMLLSFTHEATGKRVVLRFDVISLIVEHVSHGTQIYVDGMEEAWWVRESMDEVMGAIGELVRRVQSMQTQAMIRNGVPRR